MFVCIFIENGRKDLCSQREKALRHVLDVIIFVSNTTQILWPFFLDAKIITWKTQLLDINLIRGGINLQARIRYSPLLDCISY